MSDEIFIGPDGKQFPDDIRISPTHPELAPENQRVEIISVHVKAYEIEQMIRGFTQTYFSESTLFGGYILTRELQKEIFREGESTFLRYWEMEGDDLRELIQRLESYHA